MHPPRCRSLPVVQPLEPRRFLSGNGITGTYFDSVDLTRRAMTRHDAAIDFNFASAAPVPQMGADTYSVRWSGQLRTPSTTGTYTFYLNADDGVRLSVRGRQIVDRWTDGSGEVSGALSLPANQLVDLELEYFNRTGPGNVTLSWSGPGFSKQVVPNAALFDSFGVDYTYTNPIAPSGADPWVTRKDGYYYYCYSDGGALYVGKSDTLQNIAKTPGTRVFRPPAGTAYSRDLWAPELHYLDGNWYIYFAADDGDNATHRMYVLAANSQNPQGTYTFKGKIASQDPAGAFTTIDHWAIDGTVVTIASQNYFVWSGWPGDTDGQQNLYIAPMSNPWTISGQRYLISTPTYAWEKYGLAINEGPEALYHNGDVYLIYSASGFWRNEYALGQLKLTPGANPLLASSWTKTPTPVFQQNADAAGVGHASFTKSPDGAEDWIVYHAHDTTGPFTGNRDVRIQRFTWNANGSPNFGSPSPINTPLPEPSGTPHVTLAPTGPFGLVPAEPSTTTTTTYQRPIPAAALRPQTVRVTLVIPPPPPPRPSLTVIRLILVPQSPNLLVSLFQTIRAIAA